MRIVNCERFFPLSSYKIEELNDVYKIRLKGGKITLLPKTIVIDSDLSWLIGVWYGDNFGAREGSKNTVTGIKTSGRFGVINNDLDIIREVIFLIKKKLYIKEIFSDIITPRNYKFNVDEHIKYFRNLGVKRINVFNGSEWRKNIGFAAYTNNTALLRVFHFILSNLTNMDLDNLEFINGIIDSEGNVDKANKQIRLTTKDKQLQHYIERCLKKLKFTYSTEIDNRKRINTLIKLSTNYKRFGIFNPKSKRKNSDIVGMVNGNFTRKVDIRYKQQFASCLKKPIDAKELSVKFNIPHSTVKMVLRNLYSSSQVKRKKIGRTNFYYL